MAEFPLTIVPDEEEPEAAEVLVEGSLGGKPHTFLLDTGAARSHLAWDETTAALERVGEHNSSGVFAARSADLVIVPLIELGPIARRDFTLTRAAEHAPGPRSLVGMDLLNDHRLHFLFDQNRVLVDAEPGAGFPLQDLFVDSKYHPYVDVGFGNSASSAADAAASAAAASAAAASAAAAPGGAAAPSGAAAVWDTGAGITVVDLGLIKRHPAFFEPVGQSSGTDSTGASMETPTYRMSGAVIGGRAFPPHRAVGVDLTHMNARTERRVDVILGYSTLRHANWYFDFPGRKWGVWD